MGKKMNPQLRNHVVSQAPHQVGQNFSVFTMIKNTENPHILENGTNKSTSYTHTHIYIIKLCLITIALEVLINNT